MTVTAATAEEISVGAGDVFYKDTDGIWQPVGATKDANLFRVTTQYADINLNGVIGPVKGIDYITDQLAELEVTGVQLSPTALGLMIPGSTSTVETSADAAGFSSTLDDDTEIGQYLAIKVAAVTSLAIGDTVRVGASGAIEYRTVTRVGTAGIGGTGIDLDFPLQAAHTDGDAIVETDGTGVTIVSPPIIRRLPSSAYHDWALVVPGLDGRAKRFLVFDGIMTDNAEYEAKDDDAMGPRLKIQSRIDPAQSNRGGWNIVDVPAFATLGS